MGFDSKRDLAPPTILLGLLLSLGHGYFSLVGSNILLSMVVQQRAVILDFSQEKMSACPYTLPFIISLLGNSVQSLSHVRLFVTP